MFASRQAGERSPVLTESVNDRKITSTFIRKVNDLAV